MKNSPNINIFIVHNIRYYRNLFASDYRYAVVKLPFTKAEPQGQYSWCLFLNLLRPLERNNLAKDSKFASVKKELSVFFPKENVPDLEKKGSKRKE